MTHPECRNPRCGKAFEPNQAGRPKLYCDKRCRGAAYRARGSVRPAEDEKFVMELVELWERVNGDVRQVANLVDPRAQNDSPEAPLEVARLITEVRRRLDGVEAATVRLARHRRASPSQVAKALKISTDALKERWSRAKVERTVARHREPTGPSRPEPEAETPPVPRLALALSILHRRSNAPMRAVAASARVSTSYVSRVVAGTRVPSWRVARDITVACGGDPSEIRPLWATARRVPVPARADLSVLKSALRGLHLSAGSPSARAVHGASRGRLSEEEIRELLHDDRALPTWRTVAVFCSALGCATTELRALWDATWSAAHPYDAPQETSTRPRLPAASFG